MKNEKLIGARNLIDTIRDDPYIDGRTFSRVKRHIEEAEDAMKHGRWIANNKGQNNWVECSECNTIGSPFWRCCPVCEAKMDLKEE